MTVYLISNQFLPNLIEFVMQRLVKYFVLLIILNKRFMLCSFNQKKMIYAMFGTKKLRWKGRKREGK